MQTLDARAQYNVTTGLALFIKGRNLTDDGISRCTTDRYRKIDDEACPTCSSRCFSGRTYDAGGSATF